MRHAFLVSGLTVACVAVGASLIVGSDDEPAQRWNDFDAPPWTAGIEVGETYAYSVSPHCGIEQAQIDGAAWRADPPLSDGQGNPPEWWGGSTLGELHIVGPDTAVFRNDEGHQAVFVRDDLPATSCG